MDILCKSAIDINQLLMRKNLKSDGLELQLLSDFNRLDNSNIIHSLHTSMGDVRVVHAPLKTALTEEDACIDFAYISDKDHTVFMKTCALADSIGCINGKSVPVVIHAAVDSSKEVILASTKVINTALDMYPHIEILIENMPGSYGEALEIGSAYALPFIVSFIRKYINSSRVGLVLDTCHVLMRQRIYDVRGYETQSMEEYFTAYSPYLKLVHLANIKDFGIGKDHGQAFTNGDRELLSDILSLYIKYSNVTTLLTIETTEEDYLVCSNYITTRNEIDTIIDSTEGRMIV